VRRKSTRLGKSFGERLGRKDVDRPAKRSTIEDLDGAAVIRPDEQETALRRFRVDHSEWLVRRKERHHLATGIHRFE
jgi:hypothetical protein